MGSLHLAGESEGMTEDVSCNGIKRNSPQPVKTGGTPCEVKVSCTVWTGGKSEDGIKGLPIGIGDINYNDKWITYVIEGKLSASAMYDFEKEAFTATETAIAMLENKPFSYCEIIPYKHLDQTSAARVQQLKEEALQKVTP